LEGKKEELEKEKRRRKKNESQARRSVLILCLLNIWRAPLDRRGRKKRRTFGGRNKEGERGEWSGWVLVHAYTCCGTTDKRKKKLKESGKEKEVGIFSSIPRRCAVRKITGRGRKNKKKKEGSQHEGDRHHLSQAPELPMSSTEEECKGENEKRGKRKKGSGVETR